MSQTESLKAWFKRQSLEHLWSDSFVETEEMLLLLASEKLWDDIQEICIHQLKLPKIRIAYLKAYLIKRTKNPSISTQTAPSSRDTHTNDADTEPSTADNQIKDKSKSPSKDQTSNALPDISVSHGLPSNLPYKYPVVHAMSAYSATIPLPDAGCDTQNGILSNGMVSLVCTDAVNVPMENDVAKNVSPKTSNTEIITVDKLNVLLKPFQCPECGKRFKQRRELKRHFINRHTPNDAKPFKCRFCSYGAATKAIVQRHEFTHSDSKPYKCSLCAYQTSFRWILEKHCKKVHVENGQNAVDLTGSDPARPVNTDSIITLSMDSVATTQSLLPQLSPAAEEPREVVISSATFANEQQWKCKFCDKVCDLCQSVSYISPFNLFCVHLFCYFALFITLHFHFVIHRNFGWKA